MASATPCCDLAPSVQTSEPAATPVAPGHNSEDHPTPNPQLPGSPGYSVEEAAPPWGIAHIQNLDMTAESRRVGQVLEAFPSPTHGFKGDPHGPLVPFSKPPPMLAVDQPDFFGWPITRAWLSMFRALTAPTDAASLRRPGPEAGLGTLMDMLGCGSAALPWTRVVDASAPAWPGDENVPEGLEIFEILAAGRTRRDAARHHFFWRKLSKAQYEWLEKVLPGKPGWYRSTSSYEDWMQFDADDLYRAIARGHPIYGVI